jgi:GNAT superfamily N-acetyltransferase
MAAALVRRRADSEEGAIFRTSLARDLYQIGGLIEVCFGPYLDSTGQASIREMRSVGQLGPVLWLIDMLGLRNVLLGLGPGFVNRVGSRVVGNISLYPGGRHPFWGRGWLIANVAVHPDYQRRGIARGLMDAALNQARKPMLNGYPPGRGR